MSNEQSTHLDRVTRSVLWAAWADALGFITERTPAEFVKKRVGAASVTQTVEWTRRVGGKFGVEMVLPAGTYSDDTQLRLATSRAITGRGFDAEAFAKVDLAVWPSYALGGGRASKAAASNIGRPTVPWFANFFDGYLNAGGNGAAMRIQPHIWAAHDLSADTSHLVDLLRDAVITHGHPRALVGAVIHAIALGMPMSTGKPLTVGDWDGIISKTGAAGALISRDENLASVWLPLWEKSADRTFADAWAETVQECRQMLDKLRAPAADLAKDHSPRTYDQMIELLDLRNPENVGSGTATSVIALAVATAIPDPTEASQLVANALATDTDTIGTMVGAITGASAKNLPTSPVQDADYLKAEAARLSDVASSRTTCSFNYSDLLTWVAPKSQIDCVGLVKGQMALAGLALLQPDPEFKAGESKQAIWEWAVSDFGQTFLVKRRLKPKELPPNQEPTKERYVTVSVTETPTRPSKANAIEVQAELVELPNQSERPTQRGRRLANPTAAPAHGEVKPTSNAPAAPARGEVNVDDVLKWLSANWADDQALGLATRRVAESGSIEQMVAFSTALRDLVRHRS